MEHIFRAYDIRGIWNQDIGPSVCLDIGRGLGAFLKAELGASRVALGRDVRTTSRAFHGALVSGLLSSGIDVLDAGMCGFGVSMLAGVQEGTDASLYITASHLEPEWNGLKVYFGDGVGFPEEHIRRIGERTRSRDFVDAEWGSVGQVREEDRLRDYVDFWRERYAAHTEGKGLKVGLDCGGGAMCLSAPYVLKGLGVRTKVVNGKVDPLFKARGSEPKPKNLGELRNAVLKGGLAFGVAFDGDGDRAIVVDDEGNFLSTDRLGILIAASLVKRKGSGLVLANVESSMAVEDVLVPLGAKVKRIKVGHTFLTLEAKMEKAVFGVERSGHFIVPEHVLFDDAIIAPLELLRVLSEDGRKLSEIASGIPEYPSTSEAVDCPDDRKFTVVSSLESDLREEFDRVNTMDGVRVDTEEGWALIRCSNTSPVIRLTVEARSEGALNVLKESFLERLKERISRTTA